MKITLPDNFIDKIISDISTYLSSHNLNVETGHIASNTSSHIYIYPQQIQMPYIYIGIRAYDISPSLIFKLLYDKYCDVDDQLQMQTVVISDEITQHLPEIYHFTLTLDLRTYPWQN